MPSRRFIFKIGRKRIYVSRKLKPYLNEAENSLNKPVAFLPRESDSQATYRAGNFCDPENGKIFFESGYDYNSEDGQRRIAHELLHIIYFHRDRIQLPIPLEGLSIEEKLKVERTGNLIEDIFINSELDNAEFPKESRYFQFMTVVKTVARTRQPIRFNRAPQSQQDLMLKQSTLLTLLDPTLVAGENYWILKNVIDRTLGRGATENLKTASERLTKLLLEENKPEAIKESQRIVFEVFGMTSLLDQNGLN